MTRSVFVKAVQFGETQRWFLMYRVGWRERLRDLLKGRFRLAFHRSRLRVMARLP